MVTVRRITDDYAELSPAGVENFPGLWVRRTWDQIAISCIQPDTPSFADSELVADLGGDPFYQLANDVALLGDRLAERLCALTASADSLEDKARVDDLQAAASDHLDAVRGLLDAASSRVRRDWLRGDLKVPPPFANSYARPDKSDP